MTRLRTLAAGIATLALLLMPRPVAAGGVEVGDQGARAAGRGGALTVRADDLSAIYYNPAGLARLRGTRIYYSHRLAYSNVEFRRARTLDWSDATHGVPRLVEFEPVFNEAPFFPDAMMFAVSSDFGLEDWTFAGGVYGPPAIGYYSFPDDGPQRYMLTEQDVMVAFYTASVAWKHENKFGIGASLQWIDVPKFVFELVVDGNMGPKVVNPEQSRFDFHTRIEGEDRFGLTGIIGAWYRPFENLEFAAAGRVYPVYIDTNSRLTVTPDNLELTEPALITKNGIEDNRVSFSMAMPVQLRAGARYFYAKGNREIFDVELDLHYDFWSIVDRYTLDAQVTTEVLGQQLDLDQVNIERQFQNTFAARLGSDFNVVPGWLWLRAGFMYETPAVKPEYAYLDAFSFHRFAPSAGFTVSLWGVADLSVAYTYVFHPPVVVNEEDSKVYQQMPGSPCKAPYTNTNVCADHYLGMPGAPSNAGTYLVDHHLMNASLSIKL